MVYYINSEGNLTARSAGEHFKNEGFVFLIIYVAEIGASFTYE